jgi:hypothetical protein
MQYYNDTDQQERCLADSIKELERLNKQLAKLNLRKEELTGLIICSLEHDHEGQKLYEYDVWKIEVKTPFVYSLNKKRYESGDIKLPDNFNPIKESVSYSVDKRLCEKYMMDAPKKVRDALAELIDKKPGKAGITIKERV